MSATHVTQPGARFAPWRREFLALMALGLPMAATQLVQFSINTIDVLMIGRLGPDHLAGASLGLVVYYAMYLLGLGPAMAVTPLVAQTLGADPGKPQGCTPLCTHGALGERYVLRTGADNLSAYGGNRTRLRPARPSCGDGGAICACAGAGPSLRPWRHRPA